MKTLFLVGLGGAIGSGFRYEISKLASTHWGKFFSIPIGIIFVNIVGCLLMGMIFAFFEQKIYSSNTQKFIMTGFLGGFTTFSSFSLETFTLLQQGEYVKSVIYLSLSVVLGVIFCCIGYVLVNKILNSII